MTDSTSLAAAAVPEPAGASNRLGTAESRALLRECFLQYRTRLIDMTRSSLELATDLFEYTKIADAEIDNFRAKRGAWLERFGATIDDMYEKRIAGQRRKGRRPDATAQGLGVKMLTDDDHRMQSGITDAAVEFQRFVRIEAAALDQRFNALMPDRTSHEIDDPFSPAYVLDALGVTSRAVYPESLVWRSLMQRLIVDLTPGVNKIYIALNRFLADHGVLPEISAAMRVRSEHRPDEDAELLPVFKRLLAHAGDAQHAPQPAFERGTLPHSTVVESIAALARSARPAVGDNAAPGARVTGDDDAFPDLDPLLALGGAAGSIKMLSALQRHDLARDVVDEAIRAYGAPPDARVPRNLVMSVRDALGEAMDNPAERTAADVLALFFDYVFRDASLPERMRHVIGRLQIPILKAALLDPSFFHDARNPARSFLDELAAASVGATGDASYAEGLEIVATDAIDTLADNFEIDIAVFEPARAQIARVVEGERRKTAAALAPAIAAAAGAEKVEAERGRVRGTVRDRLAGLEVPGAVRAFAETIWTDQLTALLKEHGEHAVATAEALRTLDDLTWSVAAKERTGQKQRLAKMIPGLVMALRKGCTALAVPAERSKAFLDELYNLHIAAIKVPASATPGTPASLPSPRDAPVAPVADAGLKPRTRMVLSAAHDFVAEMVAGTWLEFRSDAGPIAARLAWTGSLRMRYVFASRSGTHTFVRAPEELVHALVTGPVALLLEPVPLFDRAVSAALNALAARHPDGPGAAAPA
ncbi:MAG: DUF1631 family protein [Casimicrobiaceae bacterium]